jgi:hypothetical protein
LTGGEKAFDLLNRPEIFPASARTHLEGGGEAALFDQSPEMVTVESDPEFGEILPIKNFAHDGLRS